MTDILSTCAKYWNSIPNPEFSELHYGGYDIGDGLTGISNIIWTTGLLDPWGGGCFKQIPKIDHSNVFRFIVKKGAHHYDLRGPHVNDTDEIQSIRFQEEQILRNWILEASKKV
jgi:lysosomal Pro-X carboxypeptidase